MLGEVRLDLAEPLLPHIGRVADDGVKPVAPAGVNGGGLGVGVGVERVARLAPGGPVKRQGRGGGVVYDAVPYLHVAVEVGQRAVATSGLQPQGELGGLHRLPVEIDAEEVVLQHGLVHIKHAGLARGSLDLAVAAVVLFSEHVKRRHQEGPGATGRVEHPHPLQGVTVRAPGRGAARAIERQDPGQLAPGVLGRVGRPEALLTARDLGGQLIEAHPRAAFGLGIHVDAHLGPHTVPQAGEQGVQGALGDVPGKRRGGVKHALAFARADALHRLPAGLGAQRL